MPKTKRKLGRKLGRMRKTKSKIVKHRRKTFRRVKKHTRKTKRIRGGTNFDCTNIRKIKDGLDESCDMIIAFDAVMDLCRHINGPKDELKEKLQTLQFEEPKKIKIKNEFIDFIDKAESSDTAIKIFNTFYQKKGEAIIENFEKNFNISFRIRDMRINNYITENVDSCLEEKDINFYKKFLKYFNQKVQNPCPKNFMMLENGNCERIYNDDPPPLDEEYYREIPKLPDINSIPPPLHPRKKKESNIEESNWEEEDY